MDRISLGIRIRNCRKQHRMTQKELADRLGVSIAFVSLVEKGESSIGLENFVELCSVLNSTPDSLLCDSLLTGNHAQVSLDGWGNSALEWSENKLSAIVWTRYHMDYVELGKRLRKRRLELRISQVELAEKLQLSKSFLSHVEHGNGKISLDKLVEISNILEVSLSYLLNDTSKNA